jgi:hypothetical protein
MIWEPDNVPQQSLKLPYAGRLPHERVSSQACIYGCSYISNHLPGGGRLAQDESEVRSAWRFHVESWTASRPRLVTVGCNGMLPLSGNIMLPLAAFTMHYYPAVRCNPILPFNSNRPRLPNPAVRGGMATPIGATGSKVRVARQPETMGELPCSEIGGYRIVGAALTMLRQPGSSRKSLS